MGAGTTCDAPAAAAAASSPGRLQRRPQPRGDARYSTSPAAAVAAAVGGWGNPGAPCPGARRRRAASGDSGPVSSRSHCRWRWSHRRHRRHRRYGARSPGHRSGDGAGCPPATGGGGRGSYQRPGRSPACRVGEGGPREGPPPRARVTKK